MMKTLFLIGLLAVAALAKPVTETETEDAGIADQEDRGGNRPTNRPGNNNNVVSSLISMVNGIPSLKKSLEESGLSFDDLQFLLGQKNLIGQLIGNVFALCPVCKRITNKAAKTNVQLRVVLALARGKMPSLFDLFKMASTKSENMFNAIDNAASVDAYAQLIMQKVKDPNRNLTTIFQMIMGKNFGKNQIVNSNKYASGTETARKNRHLKELAKFAELNWRNMERSLRVLSNMPPDFRKILHYWVTFDYSPFKFSSDQDLKVDDKKYVVSNNKNKAKYTGKTPDNLDPEKDEDLIHLLHEIRVDYPRMTEEFEAPGGDKAAKDAVYHLVEEVIEVLNRLLT